MSEIEYEFVEKWKKSGLFDGLDESFHLEFAKKLEDIGLLLLNRGINCNKKKGVIESVIFVIFKNIFINEPYIDIEFIYEKISVYYDKNYDYYSDLTSWHQSIDCEAEFCSDFVYELAKTKKQRLVKQRFEQNK